MGQDVQFAQDPAMLTRSIYYDGGFILRTLVLTAIAVLIFTAVNYAAWANNCDVNATKASFAVWPENTIPTAQTVTGRHPCGRDLTCIGGQTGVKASRRCHWL